MEKGSFEQDFVDLIKYVDPVLDKLQRSYTNARVTTVFGSLITAPFSEIATIFKMFKDKNYEMLPIFLTGSVAIASSYFGLSSESVVKWLGAVVGETNTNYALLGAVFILWYLATMILHVFKMADLNSHHFHIGVYKVLRKAEYKALSPLIHEGRAFSFAAMKDHFFSQGGYADLYKARQEWDRRQDDYEKLLDKYELEIQKASDENIRLMEEKHKVSLYLLNLLTKAKTNVERFVNNRFGKHDLDFFCPYTIYELVDDRLELVADMGTGANGKEKIYIEDNPGFASIQVLAHSEPVLYQRISRNKTILSYRMVMPDCKIWIMNLHINDSDQKALEFLFGDVIIDSQELLELIRAYCCLLKKHVLDVDTNSSNKEATTNIGTTGRDNNAEQSSVG